MIRDDGPGGFWDGFRFMVEGLPWVMGAVTACAVGLPLLLGLPALVVWLWMLAISWLGGF